MGLRRFLSLLVASGLALLCWAYGTAIADPVVREADMALPGRPASADRFVTAGLGTSGLPLRLGAAPDLWPIRLGPRR